MNIPTSARTLALVCVALTALAACERKPADLPPEQRASGGQNSVGSSGAPSMTSGANPSASASSGGAITGPANNPTPGFGTSPDASPAGSAAPGTSAAGSPAPTEAGEPSSASEVDRSFVAAAMKSGLAEVAAGRYVASEGRDPQVKAFAEQLQQDHAAANAQLARLAQSRNIPVEAARPEEGDAGLAELRKAGQDKLDALFLARFGASAHQESIALFERQAREGTDPELRSFANDTLAVLRRHLDAARALEQKLAGGGR